jgi:type I restriction enzyme R subunit
MMNDLEGYHVTRQQEIENFTQTFYKPRQLLTLRDHAELNRWIDPAVDRYNALEKDDAEDYKHTLSVFLRTYSYLSQVMPFTDVDLEKYYSYGKLLFSKLPKRGPGEKVQLYDDVMLEYYRLQKIKEGSIELEPSGGEELQPPRGTGKRVEKETRAPLSEIIRIINERFGTDWTEADKLFLDQLEEDLVSDEQLQLQAHSNTLDNYRYGFNDVFLDKLIARMEQNQDIFAKIMNNSNLATAVKEYLSKRVYKRQRDEKDE